MKLNMLKRHYEEEKKYGVKLQEDISMLKNKMEKTGQTGRNIR